MSNDKLRLLVITERPYFMVYKKDESGLMHLSFERAENRVRPMLIPDVHVEDAILERITEGSPISTWATKDALLMVQINQTASMIAAKTRRGAGNTIICNPETKMLIRQQADSVSPAMWDSWSSMYTWMNYNTPDIIVGYLGSQRTDNAFLLHKVGSMQYDVYEHPQVSNYWARIIYDNKQ